MSDISNEIIACTVLLGLLIIFLYVGISIELNDVQAEIRKLADRPTPHGKEERQ